MNFTNYNMGIPIGYKKNDTYYLYCDYGKQSMEISNRLNSFGYKTFYVKEGYLDFKNYNNKQFIPVNKQRKSKKEIVL